MCNASSAIFVWNGGGQETNKNYSKKINTCNFHFLVLLMKVPWFKLNSRLVGRSSSYQWYLWPYIHLWPNGWQIRVQKLKTLPPCGFSHTCFDSNGRYTNSCQLSRSACWLNPDCGRGFHFWTWNCHLCMNRYYIQNNCIITKGIEFEHDQLVFVLCSVKYWQDINHCLHVFKFPIY